MREIKFRCWNACAKTMHGWQDLLKKNKIHLLAENKHSYPVMQYTGLKDKNGVDIYEKDVVKCQAIFDGKYKRFIGLVTFDILNCCASIDGVKQYEGKQEFLHRAIRLEVIGNIYENPELLKD